MADCENWMPGEAEAVLTAIVETMRETSHPEPVGSVWDWVFEYVTALELKAARWDALEAAAGQNGPVMIFHNVDDDSYPIVSPEEIRALADALIAEKK